MSETKQTRCPHCTSVFNITTDQLAARGGHVRCGSCLQVFRADQHLVTDGEAVIVPPSLPASAEIPTTPNTSMPVVAHEQHAAPSFQTPNKVPAKKRNKDDESWATDLLGDLGLDDLEEDIPVAPKKPSRELTPPPQKKSTTKKPLFDDEISDMLQDAWSEPTEKAHLKGIGEVDKIKASADESWAQALMSELEEEDKKEDAKNYSMELAPQKPKSAAQKKASTENKQREETSRNTPNNTNAPKAPQEDDLLSFLNNNASASTAPVAARNVQLPLEIKTQPMMSVNWSYWLTWSFMCLFAATLLLVQYVYFNFNELALNDKTRPQITQLCTTLGCKVPEPPDTLLIDIQKLVVRKNPDIPNALQVNAIIFNKAEFAQPLPALKLSFLDKNRDITAARVFQPNEYLQGDSSHLLRRIPPETPIHIQLDIVNPKVDMNSYKMKPLFK